jgi:uncharacterized protein YbjT (DUF2867 family)
VQEVDAIVFTHGLDSDGRSDSFRRVDYGGVANTLRALNGWRPRIALMTSTNVTRRGGPYGELLDWKRRSERLMRISGAPYTIVRPSWFDPSAGEHLRSSRATRARAPSAANKSLKSSSAAC